MPIACFNMFRFPTGTGKSKKKKNRMVSENPVSNHSEHGFCRRYDDKNTSTALLWQSNSTLAGPVPSDDGCIMSPCSVHSTNNRLSDVTDRTHQHTKCLSRNSFTEMDDRLLRRSSYKENRTRSMERNVDPQTRLRKDNKRQLIFKASRMKKRLRADSTHHRARADKQSRVNLMSSLLELRDETRPNTIMMSDSGQCKEDLESVKNSNTPRSTNESTADCSIRMTDLSLIIHQPGTAIHQQASSSNLLGGNHSIIDYPLNSTLNYPLHSTFMADEEPVKRSETNIVGSSKPNKNRPSMRRQKAQVILKKRHANHKSHDAPDVKYGNLPDRFSEGIIDSEERCRNYSLPSVMPTKILDLMSPGNLPVGAQTNSNDWLAPERCSTLNKIGDVVCGSGPADAKTMKSSHYQESERINSVNKPTASTCHRTYSRRSQGRWKMSRQDNRLITQHPYTNPDHCSYHSPTQCKQLTIVDKTSRDHDDVLIESQQNPRITSEHRKRVIQRLKSFNDNCTNYSILLVL